MDAMISLLAPSIGCHSSITMYEYAADQEKRFLELISCSGWIKVRNSH